MKLIIANKAYSSWSFRPWLLMRVFTIAFDEVVIPLDLPGSSAAIKAFSPAGKVPILIDGPLVVWDSLAIVEHLSEVRPACEIWPRDPAARVLARSIAAEMHAGFLSLRRALPMNMRRVPKEAPLDAASAAGVATDVARIEAAWAEARSLFGVGGPFLFGHFTAADAMFAPVVNRLHAYAVPVSDATLTYVDAMMALPAWQDWQAGAQAEGWCLERIDRA